MLTKKKKKNILDFTLKTTTKWNLGCVKHVSGGIILWGFNRKSLIGLDSKMGEAK